MGRADFVSPPYGSSTPQPTKAEQFFEQLAAAPGGDREPLTATMNRILFVLAGGRIRPGVARRL